MHAFVAGMPGRDLHFQIVVGDEEGDVLERQAPPHGAELAAMKRSRQLTPDRTKTAGPLANDRTNPA